MIIKKNCKKFKKFTTIGHFCTNLVAFHLSLLSWLWPHWDPLIKTHTWPQVQQVWVWNTPHNGPITLCLRLCLSVLTLVILVHGQLLHLSDDSCGIVSLLQDGNYINIQTIPQTSGSGVIKLKRAYLWCESRFYKIKVYIKKEWD